MHSECFGLPGRCCVPDLDQAGGRWRCPGWPLATTVSARSDTGGARSSPNWSTASRCSPSG